jgi:hypothetical protein
MAHDVDINFSDGKLTVHSPFMEFVWRKANVE